MSAVLVSADAAVADVSSPCRADLIFIADVAGR